MGQGHFRALLISPTYEKSSSYLACTVEDAKGWYDILQKARVPASSVRWLSDSTKYAQINRPATLDDIVQELDALKLWSKSVPDPVIFIAYSGHGTRQRDDNGDEEDGHDEGWVSQRLEFVRDDFLNQGFLAQLPPTCKVIAVNDACHNGTVWDTPYTATFGSKNTVEVKHK